MNEQDELADFNPLGYLQPEQQKILQDNTIPMVALPTQETIGDKHNLYSQTEYDKLFRQYDEWKKRAHTVEESFFAMVDMMYEVLAYVNAARLINGEKPIMLTDINTLIENSSLLRQFADDIKSSARNSGYGIITELVESQNHLRNTIMTQWQTRLNDPQLRAQLTEALAQIEHLPNLEEHLFDPPAASGENA